MSSLLGNGVSGGWHIDVDEDTEKGEVNYSVSIDAPALYISFHIADLSIFKKLIEYFHSGQGWMTIGSFAGHAVGIERDDEFSDRWFIIIGDDPSALVRHTLTNVDVAHICSCLESINKDLED